MYVVKLQNGGLIGPFENRYEAMLYRDECIEASMSTDIKVVALLKPFALGRIKVEMV